MKVPESYHHKATSESFNGAEKISVYFSSTFNDYLVYIYATPEEDGKTLYLNKTQLELIVHAGTDVMDMSK